jgi:hypothetical protein
MIGHLQRSDTRQKISRNHNAYRGDGAHKFKDLTNTRSRKLVAQWPVGRKTTPCGTAFIYWLCLCDCGNMKIIAGVNFKRTYSCGCAKSTCGGRTRLMNGKPPLDYSMWAQAKNRAKTKGIPFDIELVDIVIPERCPLLGIPLRHNAKRLHYDSPTLDRIIPSLGYVKGNVQVLSLKANMAKSSLTLEEMKLLVRNWENLAL